MRRGRLRGASEADSGKFDFAPMVDVVLVLVIFFMLASNLIDNERRLQIQLPSAQSATAQRSQPVTVNLSRGGQITLDDSVIAVDALGAKLKPLLSQNGGRVLLRADRSAPYGNVVQVMDIIKLSGGSQLALATVGKSQ